LNPRAILNLTGSLILLSQLAFGFVRVPTSDSAIQPFSVRQKPAGSSPSSVVAPLPCEIVILHASNTGGGIDARINNPSPLKYPPFSSYNTYQLLTQSQLLLALGADKSSPLPDGGSVHVTLKEPTKTERRRIAISIYNATGASFLPLVEVNVKGEDPFFIAGYQYQKGILVVGIKLMQQLPVTPVSELDDHASG